MIIFFIIIFFRKKNYLIIISAIIMTILIVLRYNFVVNEKLRFLISSGFIKCSLLVLLFLSFLIILDMKYFNYNYLYIILIRFIRFLFLVDSILLFFWIFGTYHSNFNFNKRIPTWTITSFLFFNDLFNSFIILYFNSNYHTK